jgi:hypothetical protein
MKLIIQPSDFQGLKIWFPIKALWTSWLKARGLPDVLAYRDLRGEWLANTVKERGSF